MQTYLFYDIETTGLSKPFDQVLQFAAIRTDLNLQELERYELKIKLNPDLTPAPRALITHYIGVTQSQQGMSEIDAIKQIHRWMNTPGTLSLGYNTLEFDDEFLRFSFYRNLLPPYTHQFANQCGRMDIYPMAVMYFLFKKTALEWPEKNGKISLKLEELNRANKLAEGRAHDAMVDVEATLALAKRFFAEREMWDYVIGYFNKQTDQTRSRTNEGLMVYSKLGSDQSFQAPVLFLGNHRHYKNQLLWLRLDSEKITDPTEENIQDFKLIVSKKLAEPGFILPNNERFLLSLHPERRARAESNKKWLEQHPDVFQQLVNYHTEFKYSAHPDTDIDARLYLNSFWTDEENYFCKRFHLAAPKEKALMTENLMDSNLKLLATRLLGRHYADVMTSAQKDNYAAYLQKVNPAEEIQGLVDFRGQMRLTPKAALSDIVELRDKGELTEEQVVLLNDLEVYLHNRTSRGIVA